MERDDSSLLPEKPKQGKTKEVWEAVRNARANHIRKS